MTEQEAGIEERTSLAYAAHKNFVDAMWPRFGLAAHPGYCLVKILPMFSLGGFFYDPQETVILNDSLLTPRAIKNETYHKTAHFLDSYIRNVYLSGVELTLEDRLLHETIANLATMIY